MGNLLENKIALVTAPAGDRQTDRADISCRGRICGSEL